MKTYVITLSKVFPKELSKSGGYTSFKDRFLLATGCPDCDTKQNLWHGDYKYPCRLCLRAILHPKIHTIRANYPLWKARFEEIEAGRARLSVRQWAGKPYRSKQEEIASLTASDGIGIQMLKMIDLFRPTTINGNRVELPDLAANDGLSFNDWHDWFKSHDLKQPMAIIHFTKFRY